MTTPSRNPLGAQLLEVAVKVMVFDELKSISRVSLLDIFPSSSS